MTWGELKSWSVEILKFVGDSYQDIGTVTHGSGFSTRAWLHFQRYVSHCRYFYEPAVDLDLSGESGNSVVSFNSTDPQVIYPEYVKRDTAMLQKMPGHEIAQALIRNPQSGEPTHYAVSGKGRLMFDKSLDAGAAALTYTIGGYTLHTKLTPGSEDNTVIKVPDQDLEIAAIYIASKMKEHAVSDEVGLNHMMDQRAMLARAVADIQKENTANWV